MSDLAIGGLVGLLVGAVIAAALLGTISRKLKATYEAEAEEFRGSLNTLREERSTDKETNRKLRHELAANTPEGLAATAAEARVAHDGAVVDRDHAVQQLELAKTDLDQASRRLADRETKLREYREALHEIRISLESKDQLTSSALGLGLGLGDDLH